MGQNMKVSIWKELDSMCLARGAHGGEDITVNVDEQKRFLEGSDREYDVSGDDKIDYCMMGDDGTITCYYIVATREQIELRQQKATWYGHYNYLCVPAGQYENIRGAIEASELDYVGVCVFGEDPLDSLEVINEADRFELSEHEENVVGRIMIRALSSRVRTCRDAADTDKFNELLHDAQEVRERMENILTDEMTARRKLRHVEFIARMYLGADVRLDDLLWKYIGFETMIPEKVELNLTEGGREYNRLIREAGHGYWTFAGDEAQAAKADEALARIRQTIEADELRDLDIYSSPIENAEFSVRIFSTLRRNGITKFSQLDGRKVSELSQIKGLNRRSALEIKKKCGELGITIVDDTEEE